MVQDKDGLGVTGRKIKQIQKKLNQADLEIEKLKKAICQQEVDEVARMSFVQEKTESYLKRSLINPFV